MASDPAAAESSIWERCDEVVVWSVVAPNTLRATLIEERASPHYSYALAVVAATEAERDPRKADFTGQLGRISPLTHIKTVDFPDVRPLKSYHVAYQEDGLWHWTSVSIPMQIVPSNISPTSIAVQFRFDDDPSVHGIRTVVTAVTGYRSERESPLDMMPQSPETGWPLLVLRNLSTGTGFHVRAWPVYADGSVGQESLPVLLCTRPALELSFEAVGDTYAVIRVGRPTRLTPAGRDVEPHHCRLDNAVVRLWEDPTPSLVRNAKRISAGRELVHVPLQRREVRFTPLAEGEFAVKCVEGLNPASTYFLTATARTDTFSDDEPLRIRFATTHELTFASPISMEPRAIALAWSMQPGDVPRACNLDVRFPDACNLFTDRDEPFPYIGESVVKLEDGQVWNPPICQSSYQSQPLEYEVCCRAASSGTSVIHRVPQAAAVVTGLSPSTAYELRIRGVKQQAEGVHVTPWSRPHLFMTPSDLLARVVRRDTDSVMVAWGQLSPPPLLPVDYPPGRPRFLPKVDPEDTSCSASAGHYYYLEPLPFLPMDPEEDGELSDDDEEAIDHTEQSLKNRLVNHDPHPEPLLETEVFVPWPASCVSVAVYALMDEAGESVTAPASLPIPLVEASQRALLVADERRRWGNVYDADAPAVARGKLIVNKTVYSPEGIAELDGLDPDTPYVVRLFVGPDPQEHINAHVTLPVRTLARDTHVGRSVIAAGENERPQSPISLTSAVSRCLSMGAFKMERLSNVSDPVRRLDPGSPAVWTTVLLDSSHERASLGHDLHSAELSEVFASLGIKRTRGQQANATEDRSADILMLELGLEAWLSEWWSVKRPPPEGVPASAWDTAAVDSFGAVPVVSEEDDFEGGASSPLSLSRTRATWVSRRDRVTDVAEYTVLVQQLDLSGDQIIKVGEPVEHYFCTAGDTVQVVHLSAAARYDMSIARWDSSRCQWTPWSQPLSLTTVHRVLMEVDELAPEYVKLRWGRRQKDDSIVEYSLVLSEPPSSSDMPGVIDREIVVRRNSYSVSIARELRPNAIIDAAVAPRYANGQSGVASNPVRFLHLNLSCSVVERGAGHLQVTWQRIDLSKVTFMGKPLLLVRARKGDDWERTVDVGIDATSVVLPDLLPGADYRVCVSLLGVLSRTASGVRDDVEATASTSALALDDAFAAAPSAFSAGASTLVPPKASVTRVGETILDVEWSFVAEPPRDDRATEVSIDAEIRLVDERNERHEVIAPSSGRGVVDANGQYATGTGTVTIGGLLPDRRYRIFVRQRYSHGSWGAWALTNSNVPTLHRMSLNVLSVGDAFVHVQAERRPLADVEFAADGPLEGAVVFEGGAHRFMIEHVGQDHSSHEDITGTEHIFSGLETNAPFTVSVKRMVLDDWGVESTQHTLYTLPPLVPVVTRRSINRIEVSCSRDARMPTYRTDLCEPHSVEGMSQVSSLSAVQVIASGISSTGVQVGKPMLVSVDTTESTLGNAWCLIDDLAAAHPYKIEMIAIYGNGERSPRPTSLATATLSMPHVWIAHLGEDHITVSWGPAETRASHAAAFSTLPAETRNASVEGMEVETVEWHVKAVAHGTPSPSFDRHFQDPESGCSVAQTAASRPFTTLRDLMPAAGYALLMRSVDAGREEESANGAFVQVGTFTTATFPSLQIQKLAENFVEVSWLPEDSSAALLRGDSSLKISRSRVLGESQGSTTTKSAARRGERTITVDEKETDAEFEVVVFNERDVASGRYLEDPECGVTRVVPFTDRRILVEGLDPCTRYVALGRNRFVLDDEVVCGAWVEKRPFKTLSLLVLRVVAVGLNFVGVTWVDATDSNEQPGDGALLDPQLPPAFRGTSTFFCRLVDAALASSAAAVQFQLRVMCADEAGNVRALHSDRFVTNTESGVHSIDDIEPSTQYAVSMRVCYEGVSGQWVEPCPFATDPVPMAKVRGTSQNGASFSCFAVASPTPPGATAPPPRKHRIYEVTVDDPSASGKHIVLSTDQWCDFFVSMLRRDQFYHVRIREVLSGVAYGNPVPLCGFWTQPYPPVITELQECRDGRAKIVWGVMDGTRIGNLLTGADVPSDFVYSIERGLRKGNTAVGWKEVAVTDVPEVRFKWRESPNDRLERHCFRVRLSKLFVQQPGSDHKAPVWGDYSAVVFWKTPSPPSAPRKVSIPMLSDTSAIVTWDVPDGSQQQPQLEFTVLIDASRQTQDVAVEAPRSLPSASAASKWYLVEQTTGLHCKIEHLLPNTSYRVAVQCHSSFGVSTKAGVVTFTTRPVPNADPDAHRNIPRAPARVTGIPPFEKGKEAAPNLYDKYEGPKQRRLKALAAMAGITDNEAANMGRLKDRFKFAVRRVIVMMRRLDYLALEITGGAGFDRNGAAPHVLARQELHQPEDALSFVWRPGLFTVQRQATNTADLAVALAMGSTSAGAHPATPKHGGAARTGNAAASVHQSTSLAKPGSTAVSTASFGSNPSLSPPPRDLGSGTYGPDDVTEVRTPPTSKFEDIVAEAVARSGLNAARQLSGVRAKKALTEGRRSSADSLTQEASVGTLGSRHPSRLRHLSSVASVKSVMSVDDVASEPEEDSRKRGGRPSVRTPSPAAVRAPLAARPVAAAAATPTPGDRPKRRAESKVQKQRVRDDAKLPSVRHREHTATSGAESDGAKGSAAHQAAPAGRPLAVPRAERDEAPPLPPIGS